MLLVCGVASVLLETERESSYCQNPFRTSASSYALKKDLRWQPSHSWALWERSAGGN